MTKGADDRCMHGCYPAHIDKIREIARTEGPKAAQDYIDEQQPNDEPYVGATNDEAHHRHIKVSDATQGLPVDTYIATIDLLDTQFGYSVNKVGEWLFSNPGSQIHHEMEQRRQQAEQQIGRTLSNIEELYEKKELLKHDERMLEEKLEHFEDRKQEALKGDFVDEVDQHTGRASILQMTANDIFPSITADFYSMEGLDDLTDGHLSDLPEQEKAILRKKWKLYEQWKKRYRETIGRKVKEVKRRLKSVDTSIEQTENWIKPYVQTIQQMEGDPESKVQEMSDPYMMEGYSSSVRGINVICHKPVRNSENDDGDDVVTHRDIVILEATHISLGGSEQPQSPGQGGEVIKINFKEYVVCEHIFNEVFKPQIDDRENEVKRYITQYVGKEVAPEIEEHTDKPVEQYDPSFLSELQRRLLFWAGKGDAYYHVDPSELREELLGPSFGGSAALYISLKYDVGLYVMK